MTFIKPYNSAYFIGRWILVFVAIAALLAAMFEGPMSPKQVDAQAICDTSSFSGEIVESLSFIDQNGAAVNIREINANTQGLNTVFSYEGSVDSDVTYVTVSHTVSQCRLHSEVLPPDSHPNVDGHQVPLQHGDNLISIVLMTYRGTDHSLRVFTYEITISRAGSPSGTPTPVISAYGLKYLGIGIAKEGHAMPFILTRTGDTSESLSVSVNVSETGGDMVPQSYEGRRAVQFLAGDAFAKLSVSTIADEIWEDHSTITVGVLDGAGYDLSADSGSSSFVTDNDVPPITATLSLDSTHPQEGDVVTVTVTATTDGPKEPHNYVGNLRFIPRLGSGQPEDIDVPYSAANRYREFPFGSGHRLTGYSGYGLWYGAEGDDAIPGMAAKFSIPRSGMEAVIVDGSVTHYRHESSVPILIVDDGRAENEETFSIELGWDSSHPQNPLAMGIASRNITVPAHDDTPATPDPVSYITVDVADSGDNGSDLTVSWHDTKECSVYGDYRVRLFSPPWRGSSREPTIMSKPLGETASSNTQLTASLDRFFSGGQEKVEVTCGYSRPVGETNLPFATENSVRRPVPGAYSSEPALTSLTVTPGTLSPSFVNHGFLYSVLDVPDGEDQVTLRATAKDGYSISWFPYVDADAEADGHQVNLREGYNSVLIWVDHDQGINGFLYEVIIKGSELPVSHSANTQATGSPTIRGTESVGQTLTASTHNISDADGLDNVSYIYRWTADDVGINGATGSTYTLADADQGKVIRVQVFFTDDNGNQDTRTSEATELVNPPNRPASGAPIILGIPQVGQTLRVPITEFYSSISDPDGISDPWYRIRWLADDTEISGATGSFYTLADTDAGKAIKVRVSFWDDRGNQESLTSAATAAVAAITPGAPSNLTASPDDTGKLDLSWDIPGSNGGAAITSYKVQWRESADSWDTPAEVFEATVSGVTHTVSGLTDGTLYTFRVIATNSVGDSAASAEASGTPRDTTAPTVSTATVDGSTLTITFSEDLTEWPAPATSTFTVNVGGNNRRVDAISILGSTVTLTLVSTVTPGEQVTMDYAVPSDQASARLKDLNENTVDSFANQQVSTDTVASQQNEQQEQENSVASGNPAINGTVQVGQTLTVDTSGIADDDGLTGVSYAYQWIANDGTSDSDIGDATSSSYTLASSDVGKTIKVKVSFTDDEGNEETLTSEATAAATATVPGIPGQLTVSLNDTEKLDLSWDAPSSNGGSTITGYKVQWKEAAYGWDTAGAVSEVAVNSTTYTVSGLNDGTEYTFRVLAVNSVGDSGASGEATGTSRETTAPTVSTATVDGSTLTITFSEDLTESPVPATAAFTVTVGEATSAVDSVAISGSAVTLSLASAVASGEQVTVDYTVPTDLADARLKDLNENEAVSFSGQQVTNDTAAPLTPLTASSHDVPASHNGQDAIIFELRFSENLEEFSYKTLRDHAFTITGGQLTKARRLDRPHNIRWEITVQPDGDGTVTIVLPVTTDCSADGAVCTGDGRMLSNRVELTVSGPGG